MGRKKSNSANAAAVMESSVSPILQIDYTDPLFTFAAHPTKPILVSGLVTGHVNCKTYNADKLEEQQQQRREDLILLEKEAFAKGKISEITKSVSQLKNKWWTIVDNSEDNDDIVVNWKTKRHKGSCRHAIFEPLESTAGENLYTVGTDHIIKKASTETGKVVLKNTVSSDYPNENDSITKLCHSATHPFLLAGTENGHVLIYDSKNLLGSIKYKVSQAHDDAVNHILPMPSVSAYHYLTLGSTTLSHIDIRKGVITQSDNQDDELLSMCYVTDDTSNDTVLVSHGEGIATIWKNSKNSFMDQLSRIKINKTASIDAIIPTMNVDDDDLAASVWCGDSEGLLHRVNYKRGRVAETRVHSKAYGKYGAVDEVGILDIDYDYRLISAGMDSLKIWSNRTEKDIPEDNDDDDESDESDSDNSEAEQWTDTSEEVEGQQKANEDDDEDANDDVEEEEAEEEDDENEEQEDEDESEEEDDQEENVKPQLIRRKRQDLNVVLNHKPQKKTIDINKLTKQDKPEEPESEPEDDQPKKKQKVKQLTTKQLRNLQKHEHGIRRFEGL